MSCRSHNTAETRRASSEECEDCQKDFESSSSYCGKCWRIVSNRAYLAKKSKHIEGTCNERHFIPASIYVRKSDANCTHPSTYYTQRWLAKQGNGKLDNLERRLELLEEQNRLLRELAAAA